MIQGTDRYFLRRYDKKSYNCLHFARDVMRDIGGVDITDRLGPLLEDLSFDQNYFRKFNRVPKPVSPCLVYMYEPGFSHIGVFINGRVWHIQETGVYFQRLSTTIFGYSLVRYYAC